MNKIMVKSNKTETSDFGGYRFWKEGDELPDFPVPLARKPDHWLQENDNSTHYEEKNEPTKADRPFEEIQRDSLNVTNTIQSNVSAEREPDPQKASSLPFSSKTTEENNDISLTFDNIQKKVTNGKNIAAESYVESTDAHEDNQSDWLAHGQSLCVYHISDGEEDNVPTSADFYAVALNHVIGPLIEMINKGSVRRGYPLSAEIEKEYIEILTKQVLDLADHLEKEMTLHAHWAQSVSWRFVRAARHIIQDGFYLRYQPLDNDIFLQLKERTTDLAGHILCLAPDHLDEEEFSLHDRIDLFEALSPLLVPIQWYAFGHNPSDLLKKVNKDLISRTKDICQKLKALGSICHKLDVLKNISVLYGECHLAEMNRLGQMSAQEQQDYSQAYGDTLPITPVWNALSRKTDLLVTASKTVSEDAGKRINRKKSVGEKNV